MSAEVMHNSLIRRKQKLLDMYSEMRVTGSILVPAERGQWRVYEYEVKEEDIGLQALRAMFNGHGRFCPPGKYLALVRGDTLVMSDTPDELADHSEAFRRATGRVLINGLGLGCLLKGILTKPEVTHVDVVEVDQDLIDLIGPYYTKDPRVTIHHHDAFTMTWPKGTRWDVVWHDVWDTINTDNLSNEEEAVPGTYARLNRMYGRRSGWQGAWAQNLAREALRRGW